MKYLIVIDYSTDTVDIISFAALESETYFAIQVFEEDKIQDYVFDKYGKDDITFYTTNVLNLKL